MAKILVTGGAGYIGNVIVSKALQCGHDVRVVDTLWFDPSLPLMHLTNPSYEFVRADIRDERVINAVLKGIDYVIHTAAVVGDPASKKFPDLTREINYDASVNLVRAAANMGTKGFIFFSTCSNYGVVNGMANEKSDLNPLSVYAKTKVETEEFILNNARGLDWVVARLSTVYGASARMRFDLTVNDFALQGFKNKYIEIFLPYTYRPYIHVYDVANVMVNLVENFSHVKNNIFNVGFEGENYQKIQIAEAVKKLIPDLRVDIVDNGSDVRDYKVDFTKMEKFLNLKKTYSMKDGVEQVFELLKTGLISDPACDKYYNTNPAFGG